MKTPFKKYYFATRGWRGCPALFIYEPRAYSAGRSKGTSLIWPQFQRIRACLGPKRSNRICRASFPSPNRHTIDRHIASHQTFLQRKQRRASLQNPCWPFPKASNGPWKFQGNSQQMQPPPNRCWGLSKPHRGKKFAKHIR